MNVHRVAHRNAHRHRIKCVTMKWKFKRNLAKLKTSTVPTITIEYNKKKQNCEKPELFIVMQSAMQRA